MGRRSAGRYLLPPEELLEEVVRLRLSAPNSLLTRVRRSVDMLFLEREEARGKNRCPDISNLTLAFPCANWGEGQGKIKCEAIVKV